jgi:hypothetical protein
MLTSDVRKTTFCMQYNFSHASIIHIHYTTLIPRRRVLIQELIATHVVQKYICVHKRVGEGVTRYHLTQIFV